MYDSIVVAADPQRRICHAEKPVIEQEKKRAYVRVYKRKL